MSGYANTVIRLLLVAVCAFNLLHAEQQKARLHGPIANTETTSLSGNVRPFLAAAQDLGPLAGSAPVSLLTMDFVLTPSQNSDLLQLLRLQQTRHSSRFHQWLTPAEFADRFGLNESDIQEVASWLESSGFADIKPAPGRNSITFSGTAALVESAFHTSIHSYLKNGQKSYANATSPQLPKSLQTLVRSIRGLSATQPQARKSSHYATNSGPDYIAPSDFATIYDVQPLYGQGIDGTGRTIAVAGANDIVISDMQAFRTASGLPPQNVQVVLTGSDPGNTSWLNGFNASEVAIEWAGAVARGASIIYVNSTDFMNSAQYVVQNNLADILYVNDLSYAECEQNLDLAQVASLNAIFQQASAEGISVITGSGDTGAWCSYYFPLSAGHAVDALAASPFVTSVGGNQFQSGTSYWNSSGQAVSYIPEAGWIQSGGGASIFNSKPSWQAGTGVPNDGARDVPDVSLQAESYLVCSIFTSSDLLSCPGGSFAVSTSNLEFINGTEITAAAFAGFAALVVQQTGTRQGNLNPNLYTVASVSPDAFHDIISGNNSFSYCLLDPMSCLDDPSFYPTAVGYNAGPGYDQVTGLGSIDAYNLVREWNGDFQLSAIPISLKLAFGKSATSTLNLTLTSNFKGTVHLSCQLSGAITQYTCSVPPSVTSSTTVPVTLNAASAIPPTARPRSPGLFYLMLGLLFAAFGYLAIQRRKQLAFAFSAFVMLICLAGCGGGTQTTTIPPDQQGILTVTATSGLLNYNVVIPVDVTN